MSAKDMTTDIPPLARWPLRRMALWGLAGAIALSVGLFARYGFVQSREIGQICIAAIRPDWCILTHYIWTVSHYSVWGVPALIAAFYGFFSGARWALLVAFTLSLLGLALYDSEIASLALIVTLLRLPRA